MGRFLTTPQNSTTGSASIQNGTPKFLDSASGSRACYALMSSNGGGVAFYDNFFQQVRSDKFLAYSGSGGLGGNYQNSPAGDVQNTSGLFYSVTSTSSQVSTTATTTYINSTNSSGELGNYMMDAFSNSTINSCTSRSNSWNHKANTAALIVNSDHTNKRIVYIRNGANFRAIDRLDGVYTYDKYNTKSYTIPGANGSMNGAASYNNKLKRLVLIDYVANGGQFKITTYNGIDFDKNPSPLAAFTAEGVTVSTTATFTIPSWTSNNTESYYGLQPVLCDNGKVIVTVMFAASSFSLYEVNILNNVAIATLKLTSSLTTSYGRESGLYYGQKILQSRDMNSVLMFVPYYYYGSGLRAFIINKRFGTYNTATNLEITSSSDGVQPLPYGNSGFCSYSVGNVYASNPTGGYVKGFIDVNEYTGEIVASGGSILLPYFPLVNTTNYPGMTQVTDYSLLDNQDVEG